MTESTNADQEAKEEPESTEAMDDSLRDAEMVVAAFGGVRPMAARLGIAATTIQGWKSRGNIPENRRQAVLEAAQADGIDLTVPQVEDTAEEAPNDAAEAPLADTATASHQSRQSSTGAGPAWLALIVAILAVIALLAFPQWSPLIYGAPQAEVPHDIIDRLDALERRPKVPDLSGRIVAAERAIDALQQRGSTAAQPDVTPQLRTLSDRVDTLTRALETARSEGRAADDGSAATLLELRGAVDALSQKVDQAVVDTAQTSARKSSIIVAVGALEVALGDGLPYGYALASVQRLAKADDKDYAESVAILQTHASTGIPTRSQLASRLDTFIAARGEPVWTAETGSWTDRVLRKIDAVVSIRRLDDDAGTASTLRQARKALANNDLKGAAETLKGAGGPAGDWAHDAAQRVAADQALSRLRHWSLKALDAAATEKPVTQ
jgi:hypothetical protein